MLDEEDEKEKEEEAEETKINTNTMSMSLSIVIKKLLNKRSYKKIILLILILSACLLVNISIKQCLILISKPIFMRPPRTMKRFQMFQLVST